MKRVICFGEALIDFLNTQNHCEEELELSSYCQYPGGAPANAAVAVSKLGGDAYFLGQVGNDHFGDFLEKSLNLYHVSTSYLFKHPSAKTALAFVTRDRLGERSFSFYRDNSADVVFESAQLPHDLFQQGGIFHFCSNTLTDETISSTTSTAVELAQKNNLLICFDVNLRHNLWNDGQVNIDKVNRFVEKVDVLKFSLDEIEYLSEMNIMPYVKKCLAGRCKLLVITNGGEPTHYYTKVSHGVIEAPKVTVVDTTAGGDAFIGGLLFLLSKCDNLAELLKNEQQLQAVMTFAVACGAKAVTRKGAFPALPAFPDVKHLVPTFLEVI